MSNTEKSYIQGQETYSFPFKISEAEYSGAVESEPILKHLRTARLDDNGNINEVGYSLLKNVGSRPYIPQRFIVISEPTFGKTTLIQNMTETISRLGKSNNTNMNISLILWENYRKNKDLKSFDDWVKLNYEIANAADSDPNLLRPFAVQLIELPAVVANRERDLGVHATKQMLELSRKRGYPTTKVIAGIPDWAIRLKGIYNRELLTAKEEGTYVIPDDKLIETAARLGIDITGFEDVDPIEAARLVRKGFTNMATRKQIELIDKEVSESSELGETDLYIEEGKKGIHPPTENPQLLDLVRFLELPDEFLRSLNDARRENFIKKTLLMENHLRVMLGTTPLEGIVVANDYQGNIRTKLTRDLLAV